jgi:hypothetical protein
MGGPPPGVKLPTPPPHPSGKKASGGGWTAHNIAEVSTMKKFLPAMYWMWQTIIDPAINRKASFILKREGSKFVYV